MQNLLVTCLVSLSLFACGSKKTAPAPAADCATVISAAVDKTIPEMQKEMPAMSAAQNTAVTTSVKSVLTSHCVADKWSPEMLKCLADGKTSKDMDTCDDKLPTEQKAALDKDLGVAMEAAMGMPGAMGGGSDAIAKPADGTGSAMAPADGSGSAAMAPTDGSGSATVPAIGSAAP